MEMYRTEFNRIEKFEVVRTTDKQVVYIDNRGRESHENKHSSWRNWHETRKDALDFLVNNTNMAIANTENNLDRLRRELNALIIQYL